MSDMQVSIRPDPARPSVAPRPILDTSLLGAPPCHSPLPPGVASILSPQSWPFQPASHQTTLLLFSKQAKDTDLFHHPRCKKKKKEKSWVYPFTPARPRQHRMRRRRTSQHPEMQRPPVPAPTLVPARRGPRQARSRRRTGYTRKPWRRNMPRERAGHNLNSLAANNTYMYSMF